MIIDNRINSAPALFEAGKHFGESFYDQLFALHQSFTPRQQAIIKQRQAVLLAAQDNQLPDYLNDSPAASGDWKIKNPAWCADQRNQMTGPADDAELVVKMLNSGAPGVMIDLEDSQANFFTNTELGISNSLAAIHGDLTYYDKKRESNVAIKESPTVILIRARGLHLNQAGIIPNELMSASLFDVARIAFNIDAAKLKHPLTFYIPKSESAEEALWWRDLFQAIEVQKGWDKGFIKCFALVEAHPLAFQMEEFLFNLREHILGLNLGRWDYMASLIHFNLSDPNWVLPDRNTIPSNVPFFQNLREQMVEICHKHGALAIGGMTALFPNRQDAELNERALTVLAADKKNEAGVGMDGAWTGHPDQNAIAVEQFPFPNQLSVRKPEINQPDLRPSIAGVGEKTVAGTRAAVRTVIRYRNGVLNGKGASLLDGYMEDLATDRIYRLMIAQRMIHRETIQITNEKGVPAIHTPEFVSLIFDEELQKLQQESPAEFHETLHKARIISAEMIAKGQFDPI